MKLFATALVFCALATPAFAGPYLDKLNACTPAGSMTCVVDVDAFIRTDAPKHGLPHDQLARLMERATLFCKENPVSDAYDSACGMHEGDVNSGAFYVYVHYVDEALTQKAN